MMWTVDDFYPDPLGVLRVARDLSFAARRDYIGLCSRRHHPPGTKALVERSFGIQVYAWESVRDADHRANGAFFLPDPSDPAAAARIHYDVPSTWMTLLVYLDPNTPSEAGTTFWCHRRSGLVSYPRGVSRRSRVQRELPSSEALLSDGGDRRHWQVVERVEYKFNRAVLFSSSCFHSASLRAAPDRRLVQAFRFRCTCRA